MKYVPVNLFQLILIFNIFSIFFINGYNIPMYGISASKNNYGVLGLIRPVTKVLSARFTVRG